MRKVVLVLFAMMALVGCASGGQVSLAPAEFQSFAAEPGVVTIDVRTPVEFASGHLEGAVNMDVESPGFAEQIATLDPEGTYAVYCRTASRSKVAMEQMAAAGIDDTKDLDGGIVAWQQQGLPVSTS